MTGRRTRSARFAAVTAGTVVAVLCGSALATPAQAAPTGPVRAGAVCDLLPWLCPGADAQPAQGTDDPADPAPITPTATTGPTPTTRPTPTVSPTPTTRPTPAVSPTPTATPTEPGVEQACDPTDAPNGQIALGSGAAEKAADLMEQCQSAREAAGEENNLRAAADDGLVVTGVPTRIEAKTQTLKGFAYDGITTLTKRDGSTVRVLKFRASSVRLDGVEQTVVDDGVTTRIGSGSSLTLEDNVELYVIKQSGKVFGVLPLTISPDSPPPLILPFLVFTEVSAQIAYLRADTVTVGKATIDVS